MVRKAVTGLLGSVASFSVRFVLVTCQQHTHAGRDTPLTMAHTCCWLTACMYLLV